MACVLCVVSQLPGEGGRRAWALGNGSWRTCLLHLLQFYENHRETVSSEWGLPVSLGVPVWFCSLSPPPHQPGPAVMWPPCGSQAFRPLTPLPRVCCLYHLGLLLLEWRFSNWCWEVSGCCKCPVRMFIFLALISTIIWEFNNLIINMYIFGSCRCPPCNKGIFRAAFAFVLKNLHGGDQIMAQSIVLMGTTWCMVPWRRQVGGPVLRWGRAEWR